MRGEDGIKWLTAARVIELLSTLPPDCRVTPNSVGNLLIWAPDGGDYLAFVDFLGGGEVEF